MPSISGIVSKAVAATAAVATVQSTVGSVKSIISSFKKLKSGPTNTTLKARSIASMSKVTGNPGLTSGTSGTSVQDKIKASRENSQGTSFLEYPSTPAPYEIQFGLIKYKSGLSPDSGRRLITQGTRAIQDSPEIQKLPYLFITLPLPTNLVESIGLSYDQFDQGVYGGLVTENIAQTSSSLANKISLGAQQMFAEGADRGAVAKSTFKGILDEGSNFVNNLLPLVSPGAIEALIRSNITGAVGGIVGQTLGDIPNPNRTIQFNGVELRSFEYSWRVAPRTPQESQNIKEIIRKFKLASLPEKSPNGFFLEYPDLVTIKFLRNFNALYEHKICFIEGISVNYAPSGQPAFFDASNEPVELQFSIRLRETSIQVRDDLKYASELGTE